MKQSIKIELVLVLICLAAASVIALHKCSNKKIVLVTETDSVQYWKNTAGHLVATVIKSQDDFAKASFKIDSLAKLLKVKPKTILAAAQVITRGRDTLLHDHMPEITYSYPLGTDSSNIIFSHPIIQWHQPGQIRILHETFWNDYYTADVSIDAEGDSSRMTIQSTDTLTVTWRRITSGTIFHREQFIALDATNANPHNTIVGISGFKVPAPKPKKIGIGLQVGYGFSKGLQPQPFIGVGLSYNLIRL